jgi:hypothetical protein
MSDFQAIADRVEIEALQGEFTDAAMMHDRARLASLFTPEGALRMPNIPVELVTGDGWKFTERVYEFRYLDTTLLAGSAPRPGETPANRPDESTSADKGAVG